MIRYLSIDFAAALHDIALTASPLAPGRSPVHIRVRDAGAGPPIVFLRSGWGYEIYPFDRQAAALGGHRIVIPDRSGYGGSTPIDDLPSDFHKRAAAETIALMDAIGLDAPILWGHSDGAIIALRIGVDSPHRAAGLVVEAAHLWKKKPASRAFFDAAMASPDALGPVVAGALQHDHGKRWRDVIALHAKAWRQIADEAQSPDEDFYGGRLPSLTLPVLVVHGARDPRTEPHELDALTAALLGRTARTDVQILADGFHSPHSERGTADAVAATAAVFCSAVTT